LHVLVDAKSSNVIDLNCKSVGILDAPNIVQTFRL